MYSRRPVRPFHPKLTGGTPSAPRILLAEDDDAMRALVAGSLRVAGFEVIDSCDGAEILEWIGSALLRPRDSRAVDLVIMDVQMPIVSGLNVLAGLRRADWFTPVILITAFGDGAIHEEAHRLGAAAVFDKPFDLDDLCTAARYFASGSVREQQSC